MSETATKIDGAISVHQHSSREGVVLIIHHGWHVQQLGLSNLAVKQLVAFLAQCDSMIEADEAKAEPSISELKDRANVLGLVIVAADRANYWNMCSKDGRGTWVPLSPRGIKAALDEWEQIQKSGPT